VRPIAYLHLVQRYECVELNLYSALRIYIPLVKQDIFAFTLLLRYSKGHTLLFCFWFNAEAICSGKLAWPWRPGWHCWYNDSLGVGRFGKRIPLWTGLSLPAHFGHRAHPASCTMGTKYLSEVKWPGSGADHPPPLSSAGVAKGLEL